MSFTTLRISKETLIALTAEKLKFCAKLGKNISLEEFLKIKLKISEQPTS